jgi:hypothetical protein
LPEDDSQCRPELRLGRSLAFPEYVSIAVTLQPTQDSQHNWSNHRKPEFRGQFHFEANDGIATLQTELRKCSFSVASGVNRLSCRNAD